MKIEIKEKENDAINWDINQLVIAKDGEVALTSGKHKDDIFEGYNFNQKLFSKTWTKSRFKKFNGTVTLSND